MLSAHILIIDSVLNVQSWRCVHTFSHLILYRWYTVAVLSQHAELFDTVPQVHSLCCLHTFSGIVLYLRFAVSALPTYIQSFSTVPNVFTFCCFLSSRQVVLRNLPKVLHRCTFYRHVLQSIVSKVHLLCTLHRHSVSKVHFLCTLHRPSVSKVHLLCTLYGHPVSTVHFLCTLHRPFSVLFTDMQEFKIVPQVQHVCIFYIHVGVQQSTQRTFLHFLQTCRSSLEYPTYISVFSTDWSKFIRVPKVQLLCIFYRHVEVQYSTTGTYLHFLQINTFKRVHLGIFYRRVEVQ